MGIPGAGARGAVRLAFVNAVREFGGGERWMIATGRELARRGHEVSLIGRPAAAWQAEAAASGLRMLPAPMRHDFSLPSIAAIAAALRRARPHAVICCSQR